MKTIKILLFLLLVPITAFGQKSEEPIVNFRGVDFSCVDIVGADESEESFSKALEGINILLLTETKKFDVAKFLKMDVVSINTDTAVERIGLHTSDNYLARENKEIEISNILEGYPAEEGNILLIIATELDKANSRGYYTAVVFDGESKEIISTLEFNGKAKGFGLRNYWAGSLYDGLKSASRGRR